MPRMLPELVSGFQRFIRRRHRTHRFDAIPKLEVGSLRPFDAMLANLSMVADALRSAGVEFAVSRGSRSTRQYLVVAGENRVRVAAALATAATTVSQRVEVVAVERIAVRSVPMSDASRRMSSDAKLIRVYTLWTASGTTLVYDDRYACDVEFWDPHPTAIGWRLAPVSNPLGSAMPEASIVGDVSTWHGLPLPVARAVTDHIALDDITFPIDAVYLWVDGDDPEWRRRMDEHRGGSVREGATDERFRQIEELRYSLRSLEMYAPWIRTVYIVTDRQRPPYLAPDGRLRFVDHSAIADRPDRLPVFNSEPLVSWIHRIDGLSEQFLYMNDDLFFGRDTTSSLFFTTSGLVRAFPSSGHRPLGPVAVSDAMPEAKAKLLAADIEERYGRRPVSIVRHAPHALTRSLMRLIEEEFPSQVERTRTHRFREADGFPMEQAVHYVSQITGQGVRSDIRYGYMNIASEEGVRELERLALTRGSDVFCLNDAPAQPGDAAPVERVRRALGSLFPVPSRWES